MSRLSCLVASEPLLSGEGDGGLALGPDLPGGMSDGASPEEAIANRQDAVNSWIDASCGVSHAIPAPSRHLVLDAVH